VTRVPVTRARATAGQATRSRAARASGPIPRPARTATTSLAASPRAAPAVTRAGHVPPPPPAATAPLKRGR
jgi:hypothetical protein